MSMLTAIRHSLTVANEQGLMMGGRLNSPLSRAGQELAHKKALALKTDGFVVDKVFTSKLIRARQTAEIVVEELGLAVEIVELVGLNERDFGKYDGRPVQELLDAFDNYGPNPPTVETVEHFVERVVSCLEQIKRQTEQSTLVVSHTNTVNVMKAALFDPEKLQQFWETKNPEYCEGFTYKF